MGEGCGEVHTTGQSGFYEYCLPCQRGRAEQAEADLRDVRHALAEEDRRSVTAEAALAEARVVAEGAQIVIEAMFSDVGRDPCNNDNYCRLMDWIKGALSAREEAKRG